MMNWFYKFRDQTHAPIIHFIDAQNDKTFEEQLRELNNMSIGLSETVK